MSLPLTEYDCGKLGPVSPLSQHGHGEGLDEYLAQEAEHCGRGTAVTATQFETAATAALLLLLAELLVDLLVLLLTLIGAHVVALVQHLQPEQGKQGRGDVVGDH